MALSLSPGISAHNCPVYLSLNSPTPWCIILWHHSLSFSPLSYFLDGVGKIERERDISRDHSLHPLTALSFHVPTCYNSRQNMSQELLLISQKDIFICKLWNRCLSFMCLWLNTSIPDAEMCQWDCVLYMCIKGRDVQRRHVNREERLTGVLIELWEKCKSHTASLN